MKTTTSTTVSAAFQQLLDAPLPPCLENDIKVLRDSIKDMQLKIEEYERVVQYLELARDSSSLAERILYFKAKNRNTVTP